MQKHRTQCKFGLLLRKIVNGDSCYVSLSLSINSISHVMETSSLYNVLSKEINDTAKSSRHSYTNFFDSSRGRMRRKLNPPQILPRPGQLKSNLSLYFSIQDEPWQHLLVTSVTSTTQTCNKRMRVGRQPLCSLSHGKEILILRDWTRR